MTTPEGKIKRKITALLKEYEPELFYNMPVPGGYGESLLDYIGCIRGCFFAIEAKAPGKKPTERQGQIISRIKDAGGEVFIIDDDGFGLLALRAWIRERT
jgi:hypothetical protein